MKIIFIRARELFNPPSLKLNTIPFNQSRKMRATKISRYLRLIFILGHSATVRSRSGSDVSDVLCNFLYQSTCQKIHVQFFKDSFTFVFKIFKKNHHSKI